MFRSCRHIVFAIGLSALLCTPTLGQEGQPERTENQTTGQQAPQDHESEPAPKDEVIIRVEAHRADLAADAAGDDDQDAPKEDVVQPYWAWDGLITSSDTLAQWIMAFFGIVATGISIWAVCLLRHTLRESRIATRAALKAAEAAHKTVQITREAHLNERRPWLLIETEIEGDLTISKGEIEFSIKYRFTNFGPTPAVGVCWQSKAILDFAYERPTSDEAREIAKAMCKSSPGETIFPDKSYEFVQKFRIPSEDTSAFMQKPYRANGIAPVAVLVVAYRSALGGAIMTTPCSRTLFLRIEEAPWSRAIPLNDGVIGRPHIVLAAISNAAPPD